MQLSKALGLLFLGVIFSHPLAEASPAYQYVKASIDSLNAGQEARGIFQEGHAKSFEKKRLFDLSKALDRSLIKLERAKLVMERYLTSGDPLIQRSAFFFIKGYKETERVFTELNDVLKAEIGTPGLDIAPQHRIAIQGYFEDLEEVGKDFHNGAVLATYALLDKRKKSESGEWTHVQMLRSEYDEISKILTSRFQGSGQTKVDLKKDPEKAALYMLAEFFNGEWYTQGETETKHRTGSMRLFNKKELARLNQTE